MKRVFQSAGVAIALSLFAPVTGQADEALLDAVTGYMDFATYEAGIIMPEQITKDVFEAAVFIDTRDAEKFEDSHIQGATHIEWREIPGRLEEIPETGMVIFYCNTGTLSSQATFAARLLGRENVVALQTGRNGWLQTAAYKPE
ncbi:MAG: rhodanese-like domain-containing protein [Halocynthiibacter sp.]